MQTPRPGRRNSRHDTTGHEQNAHARNYDSQRKVYSQAHLDTRTWDNHISGCHVPRARTRPWDFRPPPPPRDHPVHGPPRLWPPTTPVPRQGPLLLDRCIFTSPEPTSVGDDLRVGLQSIEPSINDLRFLLRDLRLCESPVRALCDTLPSEIVDNTGYSTRYRDALTNGTHALPKTCHRNGATVLDL